MRGVGSVSICAVWAGVELERRLGERTTLSRTSREVSGAAPARTFSDEISAEADEAAHLCKLLFGEARDEPVAEGLLARVEAGDYRLEARLEVCVAVHRGRRHRRRAQKVARHVPTQAGARTVPAAVRHHAYRLWNAREVSEVVEEPIGLEAAQPDRVGLLSGVEARAGQQGDVVQRKRVQRHLEWVQAGLLVHGARQAGGRHRLRGRISVRMVHEEARPRVSDAL